MTIIAGEREPGQTTLEITYDERTDETKLWLVKRLGTEDLTIISEIVDMPISSDRGHQQLMIARFAQALGFNVAITDASFKIGERQ